MNRDRIVIKKYENRRLYDTTNSRYVNLDEVAQAIRDGADVRVLDATTGEDITRVVLTQIIVEDAKAPNSAFPLDVLRQMIVASGRAGQEGAQKFMRAIFDAYRAFAPTTAPFDFVSNLVNPGNRTHEAAANGHDASDASPSDRNQREVTELRKRVDELESLVTKIAPDKPARKPRSKPRAKTKRKKNVL